MNYRRPISRTDTPETGLEENVVPLARPRHLPRNRFWIYHSGLLLPGESLLPFKTLRSVGIHYFSIRVSQLLLFNFFCYLMFQSIRRRIPLLPGKKLPFNDPYLFTHFPIFLLNIILP